MYDNLEPEPEPEQALQCTHPRHMPDPWISTTGNQDVLMSLCARAALESIAHVKSEQIHSRSVDIFTIEGAGRSGITRLTVEFERRMKRMGYRVLSLHDDTDADERYILSNMIEELNAYRASSKFFSNRLDASYNRIMELRKYDFVFIHDVSRFLAFSERICKLNFNFILYLLDVFPYCKVVLVGDFDAVQKYIDRYRELRIARFHLEVMVLDERFKTFVRDITKQLSLGGEIAENEVASIHKATKGLVGECFTTLSLRRVGFSKDEAEL
jgi:hypothetical protein